jgi:hypothetical protein
MAYFEKNWPPGLQKEVLDCAEGVVSPTSMYSRSFFNILQFKKRWLKMNRNGTSTAPQAKPKRGSKGDNHRRNAGSSDEDDDDDPSATASSEPLDPLRPWLQDFRIYIDTRESALPEGMGTIQWWGVGKITLLSVAILMSFQQNAHRYPVWASLARDYLAIMASSVSSERAFSQGGITISKRRNRLKGDIVEALQVIKCSLRHDLIFPESAPSSATEIEPHDVYEIYEDAGEDGGVEDGEEEESWDTLLLDDGDNEDIDLDMESGGDI